MSYVDELLGQPITWAVPQPSHCEPGTWRSTPQPDVIRTGVVWSAGPVTGTAWVIPNERTDGEGYAVCVAVSPKGNHKQREVDLKRSTAEVHAWGLARLRLRESLPSSLARGEDGFGCYGYGLPRGDGSDPRPSFADGSTPKIGELDARGTCPKCGKAGVKVHRLETYGTNSVTRKPGPLVQIALGTAPHRHRSAICPGSGEVPAETRYVPSRELAPWIQEYGEGSTTIKTGAR